MNWRKNFEIFEERGWRFWDPWEILLETREKDSNAWGFERGVLEVETSKIPNFRENEGGKESAKKYKHTTVAIAIYQNLFPYTPIATVLTAIATIILKPLHLTL